MVHEFSGHCPNETIGAFAIDNPEIAVALLDAREQGAEGICAGFVLSQTIFTGDRPPCLTGSDCIFRQT